VRVKKSNSEPMSSQNPVADARPSELPSSYSTQEVAKLLSISVQTVQRWMDLGHLSGWRTPGGHRRIDPQSVDRLMRASSGTSLPEQPVRAGNGGSSIMLVDDTRDDLDFLAAVTQMVLPNSQLICVSSGFAAMMSIGRTRPDLLITDIAMPGFDGLEMLRTLRDDPATSNLPVIAVSGYHPEEISRRYGALPPGITVMRKPVSPKQLREMLQRIAPELLLAALPA